MIKPAKSQGSKSSKIPVGLKRSLSVVACLIVIFSLFTLPVSAADNSVSSFLFYPDGEFYSPDGYDSYIVCHNSNNVFYLIYFNDSEVGDTVTAKNYGTTSYEIYFPLGRVYYKFSDSASCFSFLRFGSETCDVSALTTPVVSENNYIRAKKTGLYFTNSSSMKSVYLTGNGGPGYDDAYYAYFNNVDSKQYILCICTVEGVEDPVAIFTNTIPTYDSSTQELSCGSNMYFFHGRTQEDCLKFFKDEDGSGLYKIARGTMLSNVTSFLASSCNIADIATGQVYFYAGGLEGELDVGSDTLNSDELASSDRLSKKMIESFLGVFDDVLSAITAIPLLYAWLPASFSAAIYTILAIFVVVLIVLIALKIIHGQEGGTRL